MDDAQDVVAEGEAVAEAAPAPEPVVASEPTPEPSVEAVVSGATRGDGSDAALPIANPGHHGAHPGRHTDQYPA